MNIINLFLFNILIKHKILITILLLYNNINISNFKIIRGNKGLIILGQFLNYTGNCENGQRVSVIAKILTQLGEMDKLNSINIIYSIILNNCKKSIHSNYRSDLI